MASPSQEKDITSNASDSPVNATAPPEKASAVWTRRIIIFAFWAVVATLGLPHWIWTTSIHREELPVEMMAKWAEGNVSALSFECHQQIWMNVLIFVSTRRVNCNIPFVWCWKLRIGRLGSCRGWLGGCKMR
jgi:hypothetical protein